MKSSPASVLLTFLAGGRRYTQTKHSQLGTHHTRAAGVCFTAAPKFTSIDTYLMAGVSILTFHITAEPPDVSELKSMPRPQVTARDEYRVPGPPRCGCRVLCASGC